MAARIWHIDRTSGTEAGNQFAANSQATQDMLKRIVVAKRVIRLEASDDISVPWRCCGISSFGDLVSLCRVNVSSNKDSRPVSIRSAGAKNLGGANLTGELIPDMKL